MKSLAAALLMSLLISTSAYADIASHRAAAEELLEASNSAKIVEQLRSQMEEVFKSTVAQISKTPEEKQLLDKYTKKMTDILLENIRWDTMKGQLVDVYVSVYTEKEIRELTAFYRSPTGRKLLEKMPELIKASMEIAQKQMVTVIPKIEALSKEMESELRAGKN